MNKVDNIDKKIIYELSKNSRQSYKEIAKNINSKKEVVAYHIKQLLDKKIITKFVPVFSLSKIGIFPSKIYIRLKGLNLAGEKKLYELLVSNPDIAWVAKSVGRWDLLLGIYTKDAVDFSIKKNKLLSQFSQYIKDYDITQIEDAFVFNRDYLVDNSLGYRKEFVFGGQVENNILSKDELKIISLIRNNARFQATDIAFNLQMDMRTVLNKINLLKEKQILQGFTVFLDLKKINLMFHKLCISLQKYDEKITNNLISYLKKHPNAVHLIKCLGSWELEIEMETETLDIVHNYINELKNEFPEVIKQIDLVTITEELKLEYFPEIID